MEKFELLEPHQIKLTDYKVLSAKDRKPTDNPGAKLSFILAASNTILTQLDGFLRGSLFTAVPGGGTAQPEEKPQGALVPEVENTQIVSDMPKLTKVGERLKEFHWHLEQTGCTLRIEYGTNGQSGIEATDCKVSGIRIQGQEGGTTMVKFIVETGDVDQKTHSKLAMLKGLMCVATLTAPEVQPDEQESPLPFDGAGESNEVKTPGQAALKSRRNK